MSGVPVDPAVRKIEVRIKHTRRELTAEFLDATVLWATGYDRLVDEIPRPPVLEARSKSLERGPGGCLVFLALFAAIVSLTGVFGRQPIGTWMVARCAPVMAAFLVLVAVVSWRRPVRDHTLRACTIAFGFVAVAGLVALLLPEVEPWERRWILGSLAVGLPAVLWLHRVRRTQPEAARSIDLAGLAELRAVRAALPAGRERMVRELDERLLAEGADLDRLDALWALARGCAEKRGVTGLERAPGPVGATTLLSGLDLPRDESEERLEEIEAEWAKKDDRGGDTD